MLCFILAPWRLCVKISSFFSDQTGCPFAGGGAREKKRFFLIRALAIKCSAELHSSNSMMFSLIKKSITSQIGKPTTLV